MSYELVDDRGTLIIHMSGTLTRADLDALATAIIALERNGTYAPPRIADMRELSDIAIGFPEMAQFAERTRTRPLERSVRTGIVVANTLQRGFARMFQILNEHPRVTVQIFHDIAAAGAWVKLGDTGGSALANRASGGHPEQSEESQSS